MSHFKHKVISVILVTVGAYFGFQALDLILGIYQIQVYFTVAWYIYAFHIFWLTFIFDLHLKGSGHWLHAKQNYKGLRIIWHALKSRIQHFYHWDYVRHYVNYLILPTVFYWSVVILMYLNPFFDLFKDVIIVFATIGLSVTYWYFKEAFSRQMEMHNTGLKILSLVKILAAYLSLTALMAVGWYYGIPLSTILPAVLLVIFLLLYQVLFQHRLLKVSVYPAMIMFTILVSLVFAVVYNNWNVNYYTAGLIVVVVYNTCWGLLHRYLERTLTRRLFWEYVFMMVVLISLVISTHDFKGQI